tara:strand:+ start:784 stop:1125 length:342 start_codon:yes stop_codon:yes gene_type:complete
MSRWENADVSSLDLPDLPEREEIFLGADAKSVVESKAFAKIVSTASKDTEEQRFYIRFGRGEILDAHRMDKRIDEKLYKFKKVSKATFDFYKKYLSSKNLLHFTHARRSLRGE